jgi:hypothetical protein
MLIQDLIVRVNEVLHNNYPIKSSFSEISDLSHFRVEIVNKDKYIPFEFDIDGTIISGEYKDWKIMQVITTQPMKWNNYVHLLVSFFTKLYNPCIDKNWFLKTLHTYNYIDELNLKYMIIHNKSEKKIIKIDYVATTPKHILSLSHKPRTYKINEKNHFYFNSFFVNNNNKQLKKELDRLIKYRDDFHEIHFHLDNNGGGDLVPVHLILRCLTGKKEGWMKNIKKIYKNGNKTAEWRITEWDCWKEEKEDDNHLNLKLLPNYDTKYTGKIYLYMSEDNASSTWFFITYLIYAFGGDIHRYSKRCYGQTIKFGSIHKNNRLVLIGLSSTTSGDGNPIYKKFGNICIRYPTEQFISCSVKPQDWNRFWIEN